MDEEEYHETDVVFFCYLFACGSTQRCHGLAFDSTCKTISMWEQLAVIDPPLKYAEGIDLFAKYKDRRSFTQFMMGLCKDFEPTRDAFLSYSPLPHLMLLSKNFSLRKIDVLTIIYLLRMFF